MTDRQQVAVGEPPDNLYGFPAIQCADTWCRAHTAGLGPWWFAHNLQGRFDLGPPHGTCYLGSGIEVAVRERLGETLVAAGMISAVEADRMLVSRLPIDASLADTTAQQATRYGITRELATLASYVLPQRWAAALHTCGWAGLCYWPRFSPGPDRYAAALFGPAGADHDSPIDPHPVTGRDACTQADIAVIGIPRRLPTIQPPP